MRKIVTCFCLLLVLVGCSADIDDYANSTPRFDLFEYFEGDVMAWGMIQDRSGKQMRRFSVVLRGTIEGNVLTLEEDFEFDDGELSQRTWVITRTAENQYQGEADDIVGMAQGREVGNALRWQYDFELPLDDSTVQVAFDDWLYRQDERHVFNLTSLTKFGVEVGRLTLFFQKRN